MATKPNWTTKNEMDFIRNIGKGVYSNKSNAQMMNKKPIPLLRSYIRAAELRTYWPGMDREKCIEYAKERLNRLESIESLNSIGEKVSRRALTMAGVV